MEFEQVKKSFWALDGAEVLTLLSSSENGLSDEEVKKRLDHYGFNTLKDEHQLNKTRVFFHQFKSPLIFILIAAGTLTAFLHEWVDASVIFLAIVVNAALGFYQEYRAETALERLKSYIRERARVKRGGDERDIDSEGIVPGDIIHLSSGSRVPADARLLSVREFSVDEAILTGESLPVAKHVQSLSEATSVPERKNMVFGGTLVVDGYATAIVVTTGKHTEIGKIATLVSSTIREQTPLQRAIGKLSWVIAGALTMIIAGIFALGISRGESLSDMFLISVATAVGAIPEALPIALTVVLAVGVERLARRKGIMRNLSAAETLGSTTVIITDKTGTLTRAHLELVDVATRERVIEGKTRDIKAIERFSAEQKEVLALVLPNTDVLIENPEDNVADWNVSGKPLEVHIVQSAAKHGIDVLAIRNGEKTSIVLPFNSKHKFSVALVRHSEDFTYPSIKGKDFFTVLGAPDILLKKSSLNKDEYIRALATVEALSAEGKRVVGVAVMPFRGKAEDIPEHMTPGDVEEIEFVGLLAFFDPVRPEIPDALKKMESYGVKVVMATGDLKGTAIALAGSLGWHVAEGESLSGDELARLSDEELSENLDKIKVFARVTPEDKLRIGMLYRAKGEVVGMTGDGVNDAPSLKAMDIGIAVGSGSDVAKDVADLVLLDDNFNTIVAAIEEGKRILGNIRKTFVYLMSNALDEVVLIGASLLVGLPLPLTALQIIWVNFFTGSLPALSFAFDEHFDKGRSSSKKEKEILNNEVKFLSLGIGTLTSALLFGLYWWLITAGFDAQLVKTFLFACFASYILFIAFSFRSLRRPIYTYNIFSNTFLTLSVAFGLVLIVATIYVPFLQRIFGTVSLSPVWILALLAWNAANVVLIEVSKWFFREN